MQTHEDRDDMEPLWIREERKKARSKSIKQKQKKMYFCGILRPHRDATLG